MPLAFRVESPFVYNFFFSWLIYLSSPSHRRFGIHSHNNTNGDTWTEETGRPLYSEGFGRLRNPDVCLFWLISEAWDNFFSSSGNTTAGISLDQKHRFIRTEMIFSVRIPQDNVPAQESSGFLQIVVGGSADHALRQFRRIRGIDFETSKGGIR